MMRLSWFRFGWIVCSLMAVAVLATPAVAQEEAGASMPLPLVEEMQLPSMADLLQKPHVDWVVLKKGEVLIVKPVHPRPKTLEVLAKQREEALKIPFPKRVKLNGETKEEFDGRPTDTRAQSLPDPQIPSYFLTTFGRSVRNSPCECASSNAPDLTQALHLINSEEIQSKVAAKKGRVTRLTSSKLSTEEIIEELYLATFGRLPSKAESRTASQLITESEPWQLGIEDFMWSLLNSTSFVFNH